MWPFRTRTLHQELADIFRNVDTQDEQAHLTSLRKLGSRQRAAWVVSCLKCEIDNGGFAQYFWNIEDEQFYEEAKSGLAQVGATEHLSIFSAAYDLIQPHLARMHTWQGPDDRFTKYKPFLKESGLYERLQGLDGRFYDQTPDINAILARFLKVRNEN